MVQRQLSGVECDFVNATDRDQYERKWRPNFEGGRVREKTQQMLPSAFLLWIRRVGGLPTSLYLYDSAGEVLEGGSEISAHRFIHFANGVALLIDPTALEAVRRAYDYAGQPLPTTASYADQRDVVDRMILALEDHLKIGRGRRIPKNLAVIFTKTDLPLVRQTLGLSSEAALKTSWRAAGSDADPPLRAWLRTHESRLFQVLETRFSKLRFFAVSALGHEPTAGASFSPKGVLAPVCWLLSTKPALSRPVSARFAGRAAECLAALGVFIGFVLPPLVGVPLTLSALTSLSWADTEPPPKRTLAATAPAPTLAIPPGSRLCTAKWGYYPNRGPTDGTTQLVFDAGGHLTHASTKVRECKLAGFQNTGCTDSSSESRFDYQGNLLKSRTDTPEPGLTVRTAFEYDDSGRLIQQVQTRHRTNAAPTTTRVSYRYDRKGTLQELSTDSNADGAPDTVDRFTALMDRRGNVVQLNVKRSKPTMTLPESSFGAIEKTTTFTYGKDGRLRQSKAQIKVAEANLKKPRTKRGTYGRSINLRRFTTLYTVSADGRVEHMKTCEDGKEDFSCATTALTYGTAGAPDTRTTNYNYESTTAELRGDCHIEQQGPLARYFVPQSIAWVNSTGTHFEPSLSLLAAAPDDPVFRVAAGGHLASSAARVP